MQENNNEGQNIIEKPPVNEKIEENIQKKKKKKNKAKKKQANNAINGEKPNMKANPQKEEAEEGTGLNNHEDLLQLLSQNDSALFEKLLNTTPDFSKFDKINSDFNETIASLNKMIDDIFAGNDQDIPYEEEEDYKNKSFPDEKNIDPQKLKHMKDLREKIEFLREKIKKLENMQSTESELSKEENEMINSIKENLTDDIKRSEELLLAIAHS